MCGITGIAGFNDKQLVYSMTNAIEHRGPDDHGYFFDNNIGLGNRRLAIIDLSTGKQPIHNEDESVWITFNGEIFNFKELKKELESLGHKFYTNSDTEVIVHAYEAFPNFAAKLSGQFAFALYDSKKKKLILARDRLGIKPLFYSFIEGKLLFASEIKSILKYKPLKRNLNHDALSDYLSFRYVPGNQTLIQGIHKLPPASILTYEKNNISIGKYWEVNPTIQNGSEDYFLQKIRNTLESSVKSQMVADVPIGVYLSGGIDSSVNAAIMSKFSSHPLKTFSVGFNVSEELDKDFNEMKYARLVAEKYHTDHKEIVLDHEMIKVLPQVVNHLDNPIAFETALPLYYLSKTARTKVKVILTGDGGDELFMGYHRYYDMLLRNKLRKFLPLKSYFSNLNSDSKFVKSLNYLAISDASSYQKGFKNFDLEEKKNLLSESSVKKIKDLSSLSVVSNSLNLSSSYANSLRHADMQHWLPDMVLALSDNMSMANSVEARVPLLDNDLVDLSFTIPQSILVKNGSREYTKPLFKKAVKDLLPVEILERKKHGFNVPMKAWQDKGFKEISSKIIESEDAISIFNKDYLNKLQISLSDSQPGKSLKMIKMYSIVLFLLWKGLNIDDIKPEKLINSIK